MSSLNSWNVLKLDILTLSLQSYKFTSEVLSYLCFWSFYFINSYQSNLSNTNQYYFLNKKIHPSAAYFLQRLLFHRISIIEFCFHSTTTLIRSLGIPAVSVLLSSDELRINSELLVIPLVPIGSPSSRIHHLTRNIPSSSSLYAGLYKLLTCFNTHVNHRLLYSLHSISIPTCSSSIVPKNIVIIVSNCCRRESFFPSSSNQLVERYSNIIRPETFERRE